MLVVEKEAVEWSTRHELLFVKNLGRGVFAPENLTVRRKDRLTLLRQYLYVSERVRQDWQQINRDSVLEYTKKAIAKLEKELL